MDMVGSIPTPLKKNMSSSIGMMNFPIFWKKKKGPVLQFTITHPLTAYLTIVLKTKHTMTV